MKHLIWFILVICSSTAFAGSYGVKDSVGYKEENGKIYILHEVEKGEGLYGIARKYGITYPELAEANPGVSSLEIGQIVLVPYNKPFKKKESKRNKPKKTPKEELKPAVYHTVASGETLYKISRKYKVSVRKIKILNRLPDNNIELGQRLLIVEGVEEPVEDTTQQAAPIEPVMVSRIVTENVSGGMASGDKVNQARNFALHKTVAVGTIILVTNETTKQSVYVRVVGNIPPSDDETTTILLTKAATEKIGVTDKQFEVTLNYAREQAE